MIRCVLAATAASAMLLAASDVHANCKPLEQLVSIDLVVGPRILVPVTLNQHHGAMFLNTGAGFSYLYRSTAQALELPQSDIPSGVAVFVAKEKVTKLVSIEGYEIGTLSYQTRKMIVSPREDQPVQTLLGPLFGVMGMDVFAAADFELDLAHSRLALYSQNHCPGKIAPWAANYHTVPLYKGPIGNFFFPMELDGQAVEATLVTGISVTHLDTGVTKSVYGFDEHSAGVETSVDADGRTQSYFRAMKLTAAGLRADDLRVQLEAVSIPECPVEGKWHRRSRAAGLGCNGLFPLTLGRDVLARLHLYFATQEHILYFTQNDPAP